MKKTTILIAVAAMLAVALAAIPALAQAQQPATEFSAVCSHGQESMTSQDMEQWMDSGAHDEWMDSADHDRMHAAMGDMDAMMDGYGPGPLNMMGTGNMMGFSG